MAYDGGEQEGPVQRAETGREANNSRGGAGEGAVGGAVARDALAAKWEALAAEAFLGIKEWRLQHPKATFAEMEVAIDERLSALRARMLQDVALASAAAAVAEAPPAARPACPVCGPGKGRLEVRGRHTRAVTVTYGQAVTLARDYTVCAVCGTGLFPPG